MLTPRDGFSPQAPPAATTMRARVSPRRLRCWARRVVGAATALAELCHRRRLARNETRVREGRGAIEVGRLEGLVGEHVEEGLARRVADQRDDVPLRLVRADHGVGARAGPRELAADG